MRVALCDNDALIRDLTEAVVTGAGHDVIGIADTTVDAVGLVESGRPDVVVLDLSLGYNTDFDVIESATAVGAKVIVFSHNADADMLRRYAVAPTFVAKPDLVALGDVLARLASDHAGGVVEHDRRTRPTRVPAGPAPTGVTDAQAFFEAINGAEAGDAMVSIDVADGADRLAVAIASVMRATDRLLAFPSAVRVYLPNGGEVGITSFLRRLSDADLLPTGCRALAIVVADGELGADAFDRLKREGHEQPLGMAPA